MDGWMRRGRVFKADFLHALTVAVKLGPAASARQLIYTPQATWFRHSTAFRALAMECYNDVNQQIRRRGNKGWRVQPAWLRGPVGRLGRSSGKMAAVSELKMERIRKSCAGRAVSRKSDRSNA